MAASVDAVGFIGLGRMGRPMAANLVAAGFSVRVWNRTKGKAPAGAVECGSPREVAEQCARVFTSGGEIRIKKPGEIAPALRRQVPPIDKG